MFDYDLCSGQYILLTRPKENISNSIKDIQNGKTSIVEPERYKIFVEPMLDVVVYDHLAKDVNIVSRICHNDIVVIITSINGLRFLQLLQLNGGDIGGIKVVAVGKKLVKELRNAGVKDVVDAGNNIEELILYISRYYQSQGKNDSGSQFLYLRGRDITIDLVVALSEYLLQEIEVYRADFVQILSDDLVELIKWQQIKFALFYSTRTAENFLRLIYKYRLEGYLSAIDFKCFSKKIVDVFIGDGNCSRVSYLGDG